jgi:hypothetical protein
MLCPLNSVHTCILYSLPNVLYKTNGRRDHQLHYYAMSVTVYFAWAVNAHTNDLLIIRINAFHISALVYHSEVSFMLSLQYRIETVKYTTKQWMFLYNPYVRNKLDTLCKRRFCHKHYGVQISASSTIFELVNKVCSAGSSSDKRHTTQRCINWRNIW